MTLCTQVLGHKTNNRYEDTQSVKVHGPATYGAGLGRNTGLPGRVLGGHTLCYVNTYTAATPTETASAAPAQQKQYTLGQK